MEAMMRDTQSTIMPAVLSEGPLKLEEFISLLPQAAYIRLLDEDDPIRQTLPEDVSESMVFYVLRDTGGEPVIIHESSNALYVEARQRGLEVHPVH